MEKGRGMEDGVRDGVGVGVGVGNGPEGLCECQDACDYCRYYDL